MNTQGIKEVDPKDIGITEEMMEKWAGWDKQKAISFSVEQLQFMGDISYKQLGVLGTFTQKQLDAIRWAYDNAEHNT